MKIGIVTTWFERGAAYVSKQYEDLLKDKNQVFIYARGGEEYAIGDSKWDRDNVYWGKKYIMPMNTYIDKLDFIKWIKENEIEIILFNEQTWYSAILLCKDLGIKVGAYIDYYTEETLPLFAIYDFLICNTKRHYSAFSWHQNCYYIPWGTDTEIFKPSERKENENIIFFHSAGMNPFRKGTDFLIEAFNKLLNTNHNAKLIIHTQVSIETYFPKLKEIINTLIFNKKLEIIEKTVSAPGLYYMGDIYVYPSRIEGIGLSIAEALSSGLPVITSDNQPMNEFISYPSQVAEIKKMYCRKDAYYWPVCEVSIDDLAKKMEYFIDNKSNLNNYKITVRNYAKEKLCWQNNTNLVNEIFENVKTKPISKVSKQLRVQINKYDNRMFFGISKIPKIYSLLYTFYKKIK